MLSKFGFWLTCLTSRGFGLDFSGHEFLIMIDQYKLKDQVLKGLGGVFRVISRFGIAKPMSGQTRSPSEMQIVYMTRYFCRSGAIAT